MLSQNCAEKRISLMDLFDDLHTFLIDLVKIKDKHGEEYCQKLLDNILHELSKKRIGLSTYDEKNLIESLRNRFLSIIHQSDFCKYSYDKPRGYSGDFITQEMIYFGVMGKVDYRYRGSSELGKLINSLTLSMDNPKANYARVKSIKKTVKNKVESGFCNIASIGCGSCLELWDFTSNDAGNMNLFLLDQDQGALDCAKTNISPEIKKITFCNKKLLRFLLKPNTNELENQNFIYMFGLLDYFGIKLSLQIVANLWKKIIPGGSILVTNAHPDNPTRLWMEYFGDWFLQYKTKDDLLCIFKDLPNVDKYNYTIDKFGVYQFLEIFKK